MTNRTMHEASCLVLAALADGSQHGRGIITVVDRLSGGSFRLRAGTLFAVLDHLRASGLVCIDRAEVVGCRLLRYYKLTHACTGRTLADLGRGTRVGDAERDAAAAVLCEHFARGRLSAEELQTRLDVALRAITRGEISQATSDLPGS